MIELWELIDSSSKWTKETATDGDGNLTSPYHETAVRFGLTGGLQKCYLAPTERWNDVYERRRSIIVSILLRRTFKGQLASFGRRSFSHLQLYELNQQVDYTFIAELLTEMKKALVE